MKDDFDEYIDKASAELDALERRERLYRRIRHALRCIGYVLIGSGIYYWASRIIGLFTHD